MARVSGISALAFAALLGLSAVSSASAQQGPSSREECEHLLAEQYHQAVETVLPSWFRQCGASADFNACYQREATAQRVQELESAVQRVPQPDFSVCENLPALFDYDCLDDIYEEYYDAVDNITPEWASQCEYFDFDCIEGVAPHQDDLAKYYNDISAIAHPDDQRCLN